MFVFAKYFFAFVVNWFSIAIWRQVTCFCSRLGRKWLTFGEFTKSLVSLRSVLTVYSLASTYVCKQLLTKHVRKHGIWHTSRKARLRFLLSERAGCRLPVINVLLVSSDFKIKPLCLLQFDSIINKVRISDKWRNTVRERQDILIMRATQISQTSVLSIGMFADNASVLLRILIGF